MLPIILTTPTAQGQYNSTVGSISLVNLQPHGILSK